MELFFSGESFLGLKRLGFASQRKEWKLSGGIRLFILSFSVIKNAAHMHRPTLANFSSTFKIQFRLTKSLNNDTNTMNKQFLWHTKLA